MSRKWMWGIGITAAVVAVLAWQVAVQMKGPQLVVRPFVSPPDCDHSGNVPDTNFTSTSNIPEYNDCQRFVVGQDGARQYAAVTAIFVSAVAPSIVTALGPPLPAATRVSRSPVGVVATGPGAVVTAVPLAPVAARAITIAMVDAGADYDPLGIKAGMNCLYIWNYSLNGVTNWRSKMTKAVNDLCPQQTVGQLELLVGKELQVHREEVVDPVTNTLFGPGDYPGVARWDWDETNDEQYVSIVCETAWCEIGEDGFVRSPKLPLDGADTREERRVRLIKGWADQQFLAKSQPDNTLTPSDLVGTIFPEPDLGVWDSPSDFSGWKVAAHVVVDPKTVNAEETIEQYKAKLGFRKSTFNKPLRLKVKYDGIKWLARVEHKKFGLWFGKENRVEYRATGAGGYLVPGTARWRWRDDDEGTWTRCTQGCCEMSD